MKKIEELTGSNNAKQDGIAFINEIMLRFVIIDNNKSKKLLELIEGIQNETISPENAVQKAKDISEEK